STSVSPERPCVSLPTQPSVARNDSAKSSWFRFSRRLRRVCSRERCCLPSLPCSYAASSPFLRSRSRKRLRCSAYLPSTCQFCLRLLLCELLSRERRDLT